MALTPPISQPALALQLDALDQRAQAVLAPSVPVALGLAWEPTSKSPIIIEDVAVDGKSIRELLGAVYSESPCALALGSYPAGTKIAVTWTVRALNDLQGIHASVRAQAASRWAKAKSPLKYQDAYSGSKAYSIPQPPSPDARFPA